MARLHVGIVSELAESIARGEIPPGEMLPREVDLVARHRVSRGVVRECVRALEERGLVTVTHGRGARVRPAGDWNTLDPLVLGALVAAGAGERPAADALECLRILEGEAAGLAAERAAGAEVARIAATVHELGVSPGDAEAELAFHEAVVAAAGNAILGRVARSLRQAIGAERTPWPPEEAAPARVLTAIAGGDADEARAAMRAYVAKRVARTRRADLVPTL